MSVKQPLLVFVGGFLAAGKTTLILKAASLLKVRGKRPAIIMNDQDAELVDTQLALANNFETREVSGGCFCCRFSDLIEAADHLLTYEPDVIFAEPVGSCIDLSATIFQPLKAFHQQSYRLAPLTVLLDPATAEQVRSGEAAPEIEYLFRNQLVEADLICVTKRDLHTNSPDLPFPVDFHLSGKTGQDVEIWLDEVLETDRVVGAHLLEVDYPRYAAAEAALGWLNLHSAVHLWEAKSPAGLCGPLLDRLESALTEAQISISHLKIFDRSSSGWIKVSVSKGEVPMPIGDLLADPALDHEIAINLRAVADPAHLRRIVTEIVAEVSGTVQIRHLRAFRPAEPRPEHRFS